MLCACLDIYHFYFTVSFGLLSNAHWNAAGWCYIARLKPLDPDRSITSTVIVCECIFWMLMQNKGLFLVTWCVKWSHFIYLQQTERQEVPTEFDSTCYSKFWTCCWQGPLLALSQLLAAAHCPSSPTWELANRSLCAPLPAATEIEMSITNVR